MFAKQEIAHLLLFIQSLQETIYDIELNDEKQLADHSIVPIDISDATFFSIITHLITPGYIASKRQTCIIALLCLHDMRLAERADKYLKEMIGKWLNFELQEAKIGGFIFPENLNVSFVHFLLNPRNLAYLTISESTFLKSFVYMTNIYRSKATSLDIQTAFRPRNTEIKTDLFKCKGCKKNRPISIRVLKTDLCPWCVVYKDEPEVKESEEITHNFRCSTCDAIYTVCQYEKLRIRPKCYYCRENRKAPTVTCKICLNKYIFPNHNGSSYTCYSCKENGLTLVNSDNLVAEFLNCNQVAFSKYFGLSIDSILELVNDNTCNTPLTIFERYVRSLNHSQFAQIKFKENVPKIQLVNVKGFAAFNSLEIVNRLFKIFLNIRANDQEECQLCFESFSSMQIRKICTLNNCSGNICLSCAYQWLSKTNAGRLVEIAQCSCPFCRRSFGPDIAKFHPIARLVIPSAALEQSLHNHMAWCISCNTMKVHSNRLCAVAAPDVDNFVCLECTPPIVPNLPYVDNEVNRIPPIVPNLSYVDDKEKDNKLNLDRIVTCSNCSSLACKALVINGFVNHGCNHIKCLSCLSEIFGFEKCGAAFKKSSEVYEHMQKKHGGYYDELDD